VDESAYRDEVEQVTEWCRDNLLLNTSNTLKKANNIQPLIINVDCVERVSDFCLLGVNIREDLTWGMHSVELVKEAQRSLYLLRVLRKKNIPEILLVCFYFLVVSWPTTSVHGSPAAQ